MDLLNINAERSTCDAGSNERFSEHSGVQFLLCFDVCDFFLINILEKSLEYKAPDFLPVKFLVTFGFYFYSSEIN